jgi:ACDE family multidrug resistance protein
MEADLTEDLTERRRAISTAWAIAPGIFLTGVGGGVVFPILPLVGAQAGLSLAFIGLILAGNRIGRVICNPIIGGLVDRYGGKRMMVLGLVGEAAVMALYWFAVGHTALLGVLFLIGRLVYGPTSSMGFVGGQTLGLLAGGSANRGTASGIVRLALALSTPSGLVLGGIVAGLFGNAAAFTVAAVAALLGAAVAWRTVPDLRAAGGSAPRRLRQVVASLSDRRIVGVASLNLLASFAVLGVLVATLLLLVDGRHMSLLGLPVEATSGVFLAFMLAFEALSAPFAGRLADRPHGRARTAIIGLWLLIPAFVGVAVARGPAVLLASLALAGLGLGTLTLPLLALMGDLVPAAAQGSGVGTLQLFGDTGGTLGPILGTAALAAFGAEVPYLGTAALLVCGLPVAAWLAGAERRSAHVIGGSLAVPREGV